MTMRNEDLKKTFTAGGSIARGRLVRFGIDERTVMQVAGPAEALIGVLCPDAPTGTATGRGADVVLTGVATVEFGGPVAARALLTSDAQGRAVAAAPLTGVNNRTIGIAMVAGAVGDFSAVCLAQSSIQG